MITNEASRLASRNTEEEINAGTLAFFNRELTQTFTADSIGNNFSLFLHTLLGDTAHFNNADTPVKVNASESWFYQVSYKKGTTDINTVVYYVDVSNNVVAHDDVSRRDIKVSVGNFPE